LGLEGDNSRKGEGKHEVLRKTFFLGLKKGGFLRTQKAQSRRDSGLSKTPIKGKMVLKKEVERLRSN